jgi:hypothetical protein
MSGRKRASADGNMGKLRKKLTIRPRLGREHSTWAGISTGCMDNSEALIHELDPASVEKVTPLKRYVADSTIFPISPFEEDAEMPGRISDASVKKWKVFSKYTGDDLSKYV